MEPTTTGRRLTVLRHRFLRPFRLGLLYQRGLVLEFGIDLVYL